MQIDIGFGDVIIPTPETATYPTLLNFPAPQLRVYSRESVVAEKFHAMVMLGLGNSRMKDFNDLWMLARLYAFEGDRLTEAITKTFLRRQTSFPDATPLALTDFFALNPTKKGQWQAFARRNDLDVPSLPDIISSLRAFLILPLETSTRGERLNAHWPPGGGWQ